MKMEVCRMEFSGKLLKRGFWLYIWDIKGDKRHLYVGRTGDSSSANASSPFRRISQHLDTKFNAKGNALGRQLEKAGVDPQSCTFEMIAIGPIFDEQKTRPMHDPLRDKTAALEHGLAEELKQRGYEVLGVHQSGMQADPELLGQVISKVDSVFPPKRRPAHPERPRYQPIRALGGASASEIVLRDRGRF